MRRHLDSQGVARLQGRPERWDVLAADLRPMESLVFLNRQNTPATLAVVFSECRAASLGTGRMQGGTP